MHSVSDNTFREVTVQHPCPICGKPNWCRTNESGAVECHRETSQTANGYKRVGSTDGQGFAVYRLTEDMPERAVSRPVTRRNDGKVDQNSRDSETPRKSQKSYPDEQAVLQAAAAQVASKRRVPLDDVQHVKSWPYRRQDGSEALRVARFDVPGDKEYRPYYQNGTGWCIGDPPGPLPLYRLDELDLTRRVHLCEGEKCCDILRGLGLNATTWAHGANAIGKSDWTPLSGCSEVVLQPDNDKPGKDSVAAVRKVLVDLGEPPKFAVIDLRKLVPGLPVKGDIEQAVEHLDTKTADEIADALNGLADQGGFRDLAFGLRVVVAGTVSPKAIDWLWKPRIPIGKLTVIAGDPKTGKSLLTADLAARVSSACRWPDDPEGEKPTPGRVVMLSAEDDPEDTIVPRLIAAGADLDRVDIVTGCTEPQSDDVRFFNLESDLRHLEAHVAKRPDTRLVIIDPISAYLGDTNENKNAEVRRVLAPFANMAARRRLAVVCVSHRPKRAGEKAIYSVMGSLGFTAAARAVWLVTRDKADKSRRLMLNAGTNLAADAGGLAYYVKPGCPNPDIPVIAWDTVPVDMNADDALAEEREQSRPQTAQDEAADWLREKLATGPLKAADIFAEADDDGIAKNTLKRAKKRIGVISKAEHDGKSITGHVWSLPGTEHEQREYVK